ncbi:hypothetical protein DUI87_25664 [Hirundo rustica rustica]|uniref:Uncharacterized protein n=1 Tax=Hirundo rustica rustica TaxID=333673 RepID=A0A3M0J9F0_HIRRU|nr:hypothetical protein DUI87_25664 [Hirundo rustica rustica]
MRAAEIIVWCSQRGHLIFEPLCSRDRRGEGAKMTLGCDLELSMKSWTGSLLNPAYPSFHPEEDLLDWDSSWMVPDVSCPKEFGFSELKLSPMTQRFPRAGRRLQSAKLIPVFSCTLMNQLQDSAGEPQGAGEAREVSGVAVVFPWSWGRFPFGVFEELLHELGTEHWDVLMDGGAEGSARELRKVLSFRPGIEAREKIPDPSAQVSDLPGQPKECPGQILRDNPGLKCLAQDYTQQNHQIELDHCPGCRSDMWDPKALQILQVRMTPILMKWHKVLMTEFLDGKLMEASGFCLIWEFFYKELCSEESGVSEPSSEQIETSKNNGQHLDFIPINQSRSRGPWTVPEGHRDLMKTLLTSSFETTDPIRDP